MLPCEGSGEGEVRGLVRRGVEVVMVLLSLGAVPEGGVFPSFLVPSPWAGQGAWWGAAKRGDFPPPLVRSPTWAAALYPPTCF